jgi:hypothetical protein
LPGPIPVCMPFMAMRHAMFMSMCVSAPVNYHLPENSSNAALAESISLVSATLHPLTCHIGGM